MAIWASYANDRSVRVGCAVLNSNRISRSAYDAIPKTKGGTAGANR
jgi:hypothetical protein